jgi:hypothetical protein
MVCKQNGGRHGRRSFLRNPEEGNVLPSLA